MSVPGPPMNTSRQMCLVLGCFEHEREALLKFKISVFRDFAGKLSLWMGEDCCRWHGINCHNVSRFVVRLDLSNDLSPCTDHGSNIYTGFYPLNGVECGFASFSGLLIHNLNPSLLELRELSYLDLSGNHFNWGRIPEFIDSIKNLRYLNLSDSGFSGIIPAQLGNLTSLHTLDVHTNILYHYYFPWGPPLVLYNIGWVSKLLNLQYLDISQVHMITTEACNSLQAFTSLPSLLDLRLSGTGFLHSLHFSSCNYNSTLPSIIQHLDLSENILVGPIPSFLANITSLNFLDLSGNQLNGSFQVLNAFPSLLELRLQNSFSVNSSLSNFPNFKLPSTLQHLDLSMNMLEGTFPQLLSNMSSLRFLDLSENRFYGSIPLWIGNITGLEFLSLRGDPISVNNVRGFIYSNIFSSNSFSNVEGGKIMGILGNLCNLKVLDLSYNYVLGGDILSPSYENSTKCKTYDLETLDLSFNNVTSPLPYWFRDLKKLKTLSLGHNRIYGPIPSILGNLSLLEVLDLSSNFLEGAVSVSHMANLSSLKFLGLSFNAMRLNMSLKELPSFQLIELHLSSCKIEGPFPSWIKMQNKLMVLDLSNNKISGELGEWIPNIHLRELNLSYNHIQGSVPKFSSSSTSELQTLDLSYNWLSGPIQFEEPKTSLCNLPYLEILKLKGNQLTGAIPDCWGNKGILLIDLSSNKLSGTIPITFGRLTGMFILKLNNNSLEGEIPLTLNLCLDLEILDLSENKLTGMIPNWGGENHSLTVLRLRANRLEGVIPPQLCSFIRIQILDLAINKLNGSIPRCFGHFRNMKSHIMGKIDIPSYSLDDAMVVIKREGLEYTHTLLLVVNMDLSCNGLVGSIPQELMNLTGLIGLNLSYNHLTGSIPEKIGEMTALESLDLSNNNLSGTIPSSMAALTSLISFNLSCNQLHGEIPTGPQLRTLNDPSIYGNNAGLCGDPLPNECRSKHGNQHQHQEEEEDEDKDDNENLWFYLVVILGFVTGFWGIVGSLVLKKSWRIALFRRVEKWIK